MQSIPQLLSELQTRGIALSLADGALSYRAPKGTLTPKDRETLSAHRPAIITYLSAMAARLKNPTTLERSTALRPSVLQEIWWNWYGLPKRQLNQERLPMVKLYHNTSYARLETAIRQLITRHDTLRTSFREEQGQLQVALNAAETFPIEHQSYTPISADIETDTQLRALATTFSEQQLPLDGEWLIRAKIISISQNDFLLLFVFHHIIVDAASLMLIIAELDKLITSDSPLSLPPAVQFTDYAEWERQWLNSAQRQPLVDYWSQRLQQQSALVAPDSKQVLSWRPGLKIDYQFSFDSAILRKINAYAVEQKTSLFNVLVSVFGVSLARWSGVSRFPIRCIGDLRISPALAPIIGYLVCSDLVEICVPPDNDFSSMLKSNEIEYHSALMLRMPTLLRHPLHNETQGIEDPRHIATTINMFTIRQPEAHAKQTHNQAHVTPLSWPPKVTRSSGEPWPILLPSIYLRLLDYGDVLQVSLELNDEQLTQDEQKALLDTFFDTVAEFLL